MQTPPEPAAESAYLGEACQRLRGALTDALVGVYAGGSWALGDYAPGRSDLDLAAVVRSPLRPEQRDAVTARLRHASLPCPARRLELVVYLLATARSGSASADFELNLNTGERLPLSVQSRDAREEVSPHWFPIDRSVLSQAGIALSGPPASEVFAPITPAALIPVVANSVRWHRVHGAASGDAVLNACRGLRFADEERWSSKPAAGRWAAQRRLVPTELVTRALRARTDGGALAAAEVGTFLSSVERRLRTSVL